MSLYMLRRINMEQAKRPRFASAFRIFSVLIAAFLLFPAFEVTAQSPTSAQRFLETRHDEAKRLLARDASDSRNTALTELLSGLLDYDALAEASLGNAWAERSAEERAEFTALLTQLVERSYRNNLESTLSFEVEYLGAARRGDAVLVTTEARSRDNRRAPPIGIEYRMVRDGNRWRVVDIITDGQSLVAGYRGQFLRLIEQDGWDGLLERMRSRLG